MFGSFAIQEGFPTARWQPDRGNVHWIWRGGPCFPMSRRSSDMHAKIIDHETMVAFATFVSIPFVTHIQMTTLRSTAHCDVVDFIGCSLPVGWNPADPIRFPYQIPRSGLLITCFSKMSKAALAFRSAISIPTNILLAYFRKELKIIFGSPRS